MHDSHSGLQEAPFRGSRDGKFFYRSPTHEEALARLHFLVENHRRLGLLLGAGGSGKTMLLEVFAREMRRAGCEAAVVNLLGMDRQDFLWSLSVQLGLNPSEDDSEFSLWRGLSDRLEENRYQQIDTAILCDDCDEAATEVLQTVLRLVQSKSNADPRLTLVLAATTDRADRLGRRVLDSSDLRIELESWQECDTTEFLQGCIQNAGELATVFEPVAASRLHQLCRGVPRHVHQLAELALLASASQQLDTIDEQTVESVYQELVVAHSN